MELTTIINDRTIKLITLDAEWEPWVYQVNVIVSDGKAYGRPGEPTRISMTNCIGYKEAIKAYNQAVKFYKK